MDGMSAHPKYAFLRLMRQNQNSGGLVLQPLSGYVGNSDTRRPCAFGYRYTDFFCCQNRGWCVRS